MIWKREVEVDLMVGGAATHKKFHYTSQAAGQHLMHLISSDLKN
jgi:hypothetical protein